MPIETNLYKALTPATFKTRSLHANQSFKRLKLTHLPSYGSKRLLTSASPEEMAHFAKLSTQWWNESGEFGLLHRMNTARVQFLKERLRSSDETYDTGSEDDIGHILKSREVLDVGCGGGIFSETLARLGGKVTGVDAVSENLLVARQHANQDPSLTLNLEYRHALVEDLIPEDRLYDVVCAMEVLEHVENPRHFLSNLAALTKPGGHIILSTISRTPLARLLTIDIAESPLFGFVTRGTHTYEKFIKPAELIEFFEKDLNWGKGRRVIETRGVIYVPWHGQWKLLENSTPGTQLANYFCGVRKPLNMVM